MEAMNKWVAEFVLRRQQNHRVCATTLLSDDSVKLKIAAVLRDMSNSLTRGRVDEKMLDLLEILEKLQEDSVVMESLKSAYCWTAVECTLRFMWAVTASDAFFREALERIWGKRVGVLKERESDLVTRELLKWESDLKMALEKPEMYYKIRETNSRYNAISHLNQLLIEHWALFGSSSLESQEEEHEPLGVHSPSLNKGDIAVARELRDCLLEIQGLVDSFTRQGQKTNDNHSVETGGDEAEDSQETSSRRLRPRLPTPEPLKVSPLKKGKAAKTRLRRPVKFWTPEQVEALREGVKEYGTSWKDIKNSNPLVFIDRTAVDLKDKWRNLIRR